MFHEWLRGQVPGRGREMCAALHTTTHQVSVLFGSYLVSLLCLYCSSKKEARSTSTGPSNSSSNGLTLSSVTTRATHSSSVSPPSHQPQSRCAVCVCERVMCGCVCVCVCVIRRTKCALARGRQDHFGSNTSFTFTTRDGLGFSHFKIPDSRF